MPEWRSRPMLSSQDVELTDWEAVEAFARGFAHDLDRLPVAV
jgi:menaquinone-dependent protoporphyrinogen IX oxidase